jgi:hypothetical protein
VAKKEVSEAIVKADDDIMAGFLAPKGVNSEIDLNDLPDSSVDVKDNESGIVDVRIVQKMSKTSDTYDVGTMVLSTGMELGRNVKFIPLIFRRQAILFDKDNLGVVCQSRDGVHGSIDQQTVSVKNVDLVVGGECEGCDASYDKWEDLPKGFKAPACSKVYTFPAVIVAAEALSPKECMDLGPVILRFFRTSAPAGRMINTYSGKRPRYLFLWELTTQEQQNAGQPSSYVFKTKPMGRLSDEWILKCADLVKMYEDFNLGDVSTNRRMLAASTVVEGEGVRDADEDTDGLSF